MIVGDCAWWLRKVSSAAVSLCLREVVFVTCQAASVLQAQSTAKCQHQINFCVLVVISDSIPSDTYLLQKGGKFSSEILGFLAQVTIRRSLLFSLSCAIEKSREMAQFCSQRQKCFQRKNGTWKLGCPVISINYVYFALNCNCIISSKPHAVCLLTHLDMNMNM